MKNQSALSATGDDRTSARAQKAAVRRAQLLQAARKVVFERGLDRTRIADVAAEAGGSQGLAHYHFESKEALLAEMLRVAVDEDIERARQIVEGEGTVAQRLDRLLRLALPIASDDQSWMLWIDMWGSSLRNDDMATAAESLDIAWTELVRTLLQEGVESAVLTCIDPQASADRLMGLVSGLSLRLITSRARFQRTYVLRLVRTAAALELGLEWSDYQRLIQKD
ncbi:TetR/AcrR family transcriptional regulator [Mycolicibacterium baixiangningiae]|uniref:TetR/AcrR family transcriptional regulator n=1 Tax=Mycolicibacterium baixiangningiae TaxID=2761578 RepID=UPI0018676CF7|nr:TetR/AcrR family transcriptional regulator [Mycolicibacterium baixiangningiae]